MGLDMYLEKEIYVGGNYEHREVKGTLKYSVMGKEISIPTSKVFSIVLHAGYWRKANHIHKWFVDTCQDGNDNCQRSYISIEQLKKLQDLCKKVLANHNLASELLPAQSGFFFGSTDYDEWYFSNIESTVKIIDDILSDTPEKYEFYYLSSW